MFVDNRDFFHRPTLYSTTPVMGVPIAIRFGRKNYNGVATGW